MTEDDLTPRQKGQIEGYARACADLIANLTGDSPCGKSYDPMTIEGNTMHSYAFDMKDGGRHHPLSEYANLEDVLDVLLGETLREINEAHTNG